MSFRVEILETKNNITLNKWNGMILQSYSLSLYTVVFVANNLMYFDHDK